MAKRQPLSVSEQIAAMRQRLDAVLASMPDPLDAPTVRQMHALRRRRTQLEGAFAMSAQALAAVEHATARHQRAAEALADHRQEIAEVDRIVAEAEAAKAATTDPPMVSFHERTAETAATEAARLRATSWSWELQVADRAAVLSDARARCDLRLAEWAECLASAPTTADASV